MQFVPSVSKYSRIKTFVLGLLFSTTLGRMSYYKQFASGIEIVGDSEKVIKDILEQELASRVGAPMQKPVFLDIGARAGEREFFASGYEYQAMDIIPGAPNVILGDICECPQIADNSFDVCFSMDVFEHVRQPWDAASECIRITKPGGLLIHRTLFAYRYHPAPLDYWRYTSQGLEFLFNRSDQTSTIVKGYDVRGRREDHRGSIPDNKPPIDWLGGFRENWRVLWIGRKHSDL